MQISTAVKTRTSTLFGLLLIIIGTSAQATAQSPFTRDITLHETTTSSGMMGKGGGNTTTTNYISGNAIKHSSSDGKDLIIRLDEGKLISIDNNKKTYSETTFQQMATMLDKLSGEMGKNPEQMEMMKKMMGQTAPISVTKQGAGESIAGYATEKYLITGPMQMELWVAPELKAPPSFYDALRAQVPANPLFDIGKMYDEMKKIGGIALKSNMTIKVMNMEIKTSTVVTSVVKGAIPASTFAIPAGYSPVTAKTN
jgi:hypothetical protein